MNNVDNMLENIHNTVGPFYCGGFKLNERFVFSSENTQTFTDSSVIAARMPLNQLFVICHNLYELFTKSPLLFAKARVIFFCENGCAIYSIEKEEAGFFLKVESIELGTLHAPAEMDRELSLPDRFKKTRFIGICATTVDGVIGKKGDKALLWKCPEDLSIFQKTTEFSVIVMGGATYRAIGKALPNRMNVVISRDKNLGPNQGVFRYSGLEDFNNALSRFTEVKRVFIIGGESIFDMFKHHMTDYQVTQIPIISDPCDINDYARMPSIHPVSFTKKKAKMVPATVNGAEAMITIQNYKRRSIIKLAE